MAKRSKRTRPLGRNRKAAVGTIREILGAQLRRPLGRLLATTSVAALAIGLMTATPGQAAIFTCTWTNGAAGTWNIASNWSTCNSVFPNNGVDNFNATIAAPGTYTVSVTNSNVIDNLTINSANATVSLNSGGILQVNTLATITSGTLLFNGGTLRNTIVRQTGTNGLRFSGSSSNILDNVTVRGVLDLSAASSTVRVLNGLTLQTEAGAIPGTANVTGGSAVIEFDGAAAGWAQSFNNATINLGSAANFGRITLERGGTLTLGSGAILQGRGAIGDTLFVAGGSSTLINQGTISANISGQTLTIGTTGSGVNTFTNNNITEARNGGTLTINALNWTNGATGQLNVLAGSTLNLQSNWSNSGQINVTSGTLNLNGAFTLAGVGTINNTGGTINLLGTLDNTATTLTLNATTGNWTLTGGRINNGTVQQTGANGLRFNSSNSNTLDGVTVRGVLDLSAASSTVRVLNGLTLLTEAGATPGTANVTGTSAVMEFDGTAAGWAQSFNNATINLGTAANFGRILLERGGTLTLGSGAIIQGRGAIGDTVFVSGGASTLINGGTISANISGQTLTVGTTNLGSGLSTFTNNNITEARNGGTLTINALNWTNGATGQLNVLAGSILNLQNNWSNSGQINVTSGTLNLNGAFTLAGVGTINNTGGTINLLGTLDNTASTLTLNATTGNWTLTGGRINNGTVQQTGANGLRFNSSSNNILDNVTVRGVLDLSAASSTVRVLNGLTLLTEAGATPGTANVTGTSAVMEFDGTAAGWAQSFNNATINLGTAANFGRILLERGGTLTLGSGAIIQGRGAIGDTVFVSGGASTLINGGTISANISGQTLTVGTTNLGSGLSTFTNNNITEARNGGTLTINALNWTNGATGQLNVLAGSILNLQNNWSNSGQINVTSGTLNLNGAFTLAGIGTINNTGGTINLLGTLDNAASTLTLNATTGNWTLTGGRINNGTVQQTGANGLRFNSSSNNILDNVTVRGVLDLSAASSTVRLLNTSIANGTSAPAITLLTEAGGTPGTANVTGSSAVMEFDGVAAGWVRTLDNATINLGTAANFGRILLERGGTLTLGSGATIQGRGAIGDTVFIAGGASTLINGGTISANISGQTLTVGTINVGSGLNTLTNQGLLEARNGGVLTINPASWTNPTGQITVVDATSTVNLAGTVTTGGLGKFRNSAGGTLNLTGVLTNTGATLEFSPAGDTNRGTLQLSGGRIVGGTVQQVGANRLLFTNNSNNALDNVTLRGVLDLSAASATVRVLNGLTLQTEAGAIPGTANVTGSSAVMEFDGAAAGWAQSFDNATINLGTAANFGRILLERGGTLTLGSGAIIQGRGAIGDTIFFAGGASTLINQGTISANISGQTLTVGTINVGSGLNTLTNQGLLEARNGGVLTINPASWTNPTGQITVVDATSTVNLAGTVTTGGLGKFRNSAGGTLNLTGVLTNTGATLEFSPAGDTNRGTLQLSGGRIVGGTVQQVGANRLLFTNNSNNALDNVTLRGVLDLSAASATVRVLNGLTLQTEAGAIPGTANVTGSSAVMEFDGAAAGWAQSFDNATINLGTAANFGRILLERGGTLTLGSGAIIQGRGAIGDTIFFAGGASTLINQGTISANISGQTLTVGTINVGSGLNTLTNQGLLEARNGGVLTINPASWTNPTGQITVVDATSTVNLAGTVTTGGLGKFRNSAGGTLNLTGVLTNTGATLEFSPAGDTNRGTLQLSGGRIVGGTVQQVGANRLLFTNNSNNALDNVTLRGVLDLSAASATVRVLNGLTLQTEAGAIPGTANVTGSSAVMEFDGAAAGWAQSFDNATINLGTAANFGRILLERGGTLTLGSGAIIQGRGAIGDTIFFAGGASTLINQGTISANISGQTLTVGTINVGSGLNTLTNQGVIEARNGGTVVVAPATNTNFTSGLLTGGSWKAVGSGSIMELRGPSGAGVDPTIVTNAADITLDGTGSVFRTRHPTTSVLTSLETSLATNAAAGALRVLGNRNYTTANAFTNNGTLQLGGGTFDAASISNSATGTIRGFGTFVDDINTSSGIVRAEGGVLNMRRIIGASGTVQIDAGASLNLSAATGTSSADFLIHNGTNLNLGANNFVVAQNYTNGNSGIGNAFDARANVTGTGLIVTSVAQSQTINQTGGAAVLSNGTTATPSVNFGNVRIGEAKTLNFNVGNTTAGATAVLNGAFKTTGLNAAQFTGSAVGSGSGANWTAAAGGTSAGFDLTFAPTTRGALAGQSLQVVNNFSNVAGQTISLGANGYLQAQPTFGTLNFGSVLAGSTTVINLTVNNVGVIGDLFQEGLNASWGTVTNGGLGTVTALAGAITNLAAGLSNASTLQLQLVAGGTAGAVNGNVQVILATNGTGTSGLGTLALPTQLLSYGGVISGVVTNLAAGSAAPTTLNFGNKRVNDVVAAQALTITNTAAAPAEGLNASFGVPSITGILAAGSVTSLAAQTQNTVAMTVGIDTTTAGSRNGNVAVNFISDGSANGGVTTSVGSQAITVTGGVFRPGQGAATPAPVNLGNFRLGGAAPAAQALAVQNTAVADGFSESVGIGSANATGAFSVTNNLGATRINPTLSQASALSVSLGAGATSGINNGNLAIQYVTDGTGSSSLGVINANLQNVALQATGFNPAAANTLPNVVLANRHVNVAASQALSISNTAPTGAFTERLNASFGTLTGNATTNGGSIALLSPEASPNTAMSVGFATATAGLKSGTVQVNFQTDGAGTSGLASAPLASQTITVSGNVFAFATPTVANQASVLNFGNVLQNSVQSRALSITNTLVAANAAFQEGLDASFGAVQGPDAVKFTTAGSIVNLGAGATNNAAMTVALNTSLAGTFTASVPLAFVSNGTISGLANTGLTGVNLPANATVTVNIGNFAIANLQPTSVNFGKFREGQVTSQNQALTITNALIGPGEGLNASFGANTGTASNNGGTITSLAGQASNSVAMNVSLNGLATAGAKGGSVTVNFASDGTFNGGTLTPLTPQPVSLSAEIYRLGQGAATPTPVNLGNFRLGDVAPAAQALAVQNTAAADGFSESAGIGTANATGAFNVANNLGATRINPTLSQASALSVSLGAGAIAGVNNGNLAIQYVSDGAGSSGLGVINANSQNVALQATGFNAAAANTLPNVVLANRHVNDAATQTLSISNTAPGTFSESLNASFGTLTGNATTNGASIALLTPAASPNTTMSVGFATGTAGLKSGTVQVNFQTDGLGTSGLASAPLASQTITVSGNVYALANAASVAAVNFGNVLRNSVQSRALTITNTGVVGDLFQEGLNASFGTVSGSDAVKFTPSGSVTNLASGLSNNSAMTIALDTSATGTFTANAALNFVSNGTISGLANSNLAGQGVPLSANVTLNVGDLAQGQVAPTNVAFGNRRVGDVVTPQALTVSNLTPVGEGLQASIALQPGAVGVTASGAPILVAAGAAPNTSFTVGLDTATTGAKSGTARVSMTSDGTFNGGVTTPLAPQDVTVSGSVFRLGQGAATPAPVNLGNFRLGGASPTSQALAVQNTAAADGFSESVGVGTAIATGAFNVANNLGATRINPQASQANALSVSLGAGAAAGVNNGNLAIQYVSDGAGSSGLGVIDANSQNVALQATGFNPAAANTLANVVLANRHVNDAASQALSISNTAPATFSESLNASFGTLTGNATTNGASIALLTPAASPNTTMSVGFATGTAGLKSGTVQVNFQTDGAGTSGLTAAPLLSQTITVSGNVFALASASVANQANVLSFGNVLRDSVQSRTLSITNTLTAADAAFQEGLNASFGIVTGADAVKFTTGGSITNLGAGLTNNAAMTVALNTSATGSFSAIVPVAFVSNGAISGLANTNLPGVDLAASATVFVNVGDLAVAGLQPTTVNFGKFREGQVASQTQALTISNLIAVGEGLNASFGAATGTASNNGGTITALAPGASNSAAMSVTLNGLATAGAKNGTQTVDFVSDGTFNSGVTTPLPSQQVALSAEVYRLAQASVPASIVLASRRVGDAAASATLTIANAAPSDGFSESLKATIGAAPPPFAVGASGTTIVVAAGNSEVQSVALPTATAGSFTGNLNIALASNGAGTSGFGDLALPDANVALSGKVYAAATANLSQGAINFGLRRVGDAVAPVALNVTNGASGALTDVLNAVGGPSAPGPFSASGPAAGPLTTGGLAAGATQNAAYAFGMNTSAAGNFSGNASIGFASSNSDMADAALSQLVALQGVVNNIARPGINKVGGAGTLTSGLNSFTLDFGNVVQNTDVVATLLSLLNDIDAAAPGDRLKIRFDRTIATAPFIVSSFFDVFVELDPGASLASLLAVDLDTAALGSFSDSFTIEAYSVNGVLTDLPLASMSFTFQGNVIAGGGVDVPVPATWTLLGVGAVALWRLRRRRS